MMGSPHARGVVLFMLFGAVSCDSWLSSRSICSSGSTNLALRGGFEGAAGGGGSKNPRFPAPPFPLALMKPHPGRLARLLVSYLGIFFSVMTCLRFFCFFPGVEEEASGGGVVVGGVVVCARTRLQMGRLMS